MTGVELSVTLLTDIFSVIGITVTPLRSLIFPDNEISNGLSSLIFSSFP